MCERFLSLKHLLRLESLTLCVDIEVLELLLPVLSEHDAEAGPAQTSNSNFTMSEAAQRILCEEVQQQMDAERDPKMEIEAQQEEDRRARCLLWILARSTEVWLT